MFILVCCTPKISTNHHLASFCRSWASAEAWNINIVSNTYLPYLCYFLRTSNPTVRTAYAWLRGSFTASCSRRSVRSNRPMKHQSSLRALETFHETPFSCPICAYVKVVPQSTLLCGGDMAISWIWATQPTCKYLIILQWLQRPCMEKQKRSTAKLDEIRVQRLKSLRGLSLVYNIVNMELFFQHYQTLFSVSSHVFSNCSWACWLQS